VGVEQGADPMTTVMPPTAGIIGVHPGAEVWDRLTRETPKAWRAFELYRDMGLGRSYAKVAQELPNQTRAGRLGVSVQLIKRWAKEFQWQDRVKAFDAHEARIASGERQDAIREMNERHANIAQHLQAKVIERLATVNPADLTIGQLPKYLEAAVKVERLARGATTENVGLTAAAPDEEFSGLEGTDLAGHVKNVVRGALIAKGVDPDDADQALEEASAYEDEPAEAA
jgi:hypothetical protein